MQNRAFIQSLLKISQHDLQSSIAEHKSRRCCQSLFALQQSLEKANKSMVLVTDYYSGSDLKNFNHSQSALIKGVIKKHEKELMAPMVDPVNAKSFFGIFELIGLDYSSYMKRLASMDNDIEYIKAEISWQKLTPAKIDQFLDMLDDVNELGSLNEPKVFVAFQTHVEEQLPAFFDSLAILFGDEILTEKAVQKQAAQLIGYMLTNMLSFSTAGFSLQVLGFIFSPIVSKVRYPEFENGTLYDPVSVFNGRHPLVKRMPKFQNITRKALQNLKKVVSASYLNASV